MADELNLSSINAIVEFDDAAAFFRQRAISGCPICAYTKWSLLPTDGEEGSRYSLGLPGVSLPARQTFQSAIPVIVATCKRCSFMRMHNASDIAKWVEDGRPEFSDAD
jgi:hypothetical protein